MLYRITITLQIPGTTGRTILQSSFTEEFSSLQGAMMRATSHANVLAGAYSGNAIAEAPAYVSSIKVAQA